MELEVINPEHEVHGKMLHNESHKHESIFTSVTVQENKSVMLSSLQKHFGSGFHTEKENSTYQWVKTSIIS
jgi:phosphoribosylformylglycinamidine (FGAM) synthase-like amidotransferase family enzyme